MAILGPSDLPLLKIDSNPLKLHILSQLGHPAVAVELTEVQMEQILRSTGDFVMRYFPLQEKYAYFITSPLVSEYPVPEGAYWIRSVAWDPGSVQISDLFSSEVFLFNLTSLTGYQNFLTDYVMLQQYRKFSQRILGNEGHWEYKVSTNTIRLFPTPRGAFPVVVQYLPSVTEFRSPQSKELTYRACLAQAKISLGHARRKFSGLPGPDGGQITTDGDKLVSEGAEEYKTIEEFAIKQGEPLGPFVW